MSGGFRTLYLALDDSSDDDLKAVIGELIKAKPDLEAEVIAGLDDIRHATGQQITTVMGLDRGSLVQMLEGMVKKKPGLALEISARLENIRNSREKFFKNMKNNFDALEQLHEGILWVDVERSLKADPESIRRLMALDEKGHAMNVFGEENGEYIFVSGWTKYEKVSPDHRNISYDADGEKLAKKFGFKPSGNAASIIAKIMGVNENEAGNYLADKKFHKQLLKAIAVRGWAWLKTDAATRKNGVAISGNNNEVREYSMRNHVVSGSFRAELRVKKVA